MSDSPRGQSGPGRAADGSGRQVHVPERVILYTSDLRWYAAFRGKSNFTVSQCMHCAYSHPSDKKQKRRGGWGTGLSAGLPRILLTIHLTSTRDLLFLPLYLRLHAAEGLGRFVEDLAAVASANSSS